MAKNELTAALRGPALDAIAARLRCRRCCHTLGGNSGIERLGELAHRHNQLVVLLGHGKHAPLARVSRHRAHHLRLLCGGAQVQAHLGSRFGKRVLVALLASFS